MSSGVHGPELLQILKTKARAKVLDSATDYINERLLAGFDEFSYSILSSFLVGVDFPAKEYMKQLRARCEAAGWNAILSEDFTTITLSEKAK